MGKSAYSRRLVDFDAFVDNIVDWVEGSKKEAERKARELALNVMEDLVTNAPQWSGQFAANYKLGVRSYFKVRRNTLFSPDVDFSQSINESGDDVSVDFSPQSRGSAGAINFAMANARQSAKRFQLGDTLFVYNVTPFDGIVKPLEERKSEIKSLDAYFRFLNANPDLLEKNIRPVNLVGGEIILYEHVISKYL